MRRLLRKVLTAASFVGIGTMLDSLFQPLTIGPVELPCRIVSSSHQTTLVENHLPTADFVAYRGAFCQYKTVAADGLIRIPDSLPTRVAALAEPMAITLHALRLADVRPDDRVLVISAALRRIAARRAALIESRQAPTQAAS